MRYEFFIARRYLRSKQKTGIISTITYIAVGGVVLGVAALVIILSVANGFSGEVKNRLLGMNAHVSVQKYYGDTIEEYEATGNLLESLPGIVAAAPIIDAKVGIAAKGNLEKFDGVVLWGIEPDSFSAVSDLPAHLTYEQSDALLLDPPKGSKYPGIILGEHLSRRLRVGPGDEVLLITFNKGLEEAIVGGIAPRLWPFVVTDTFESGMYQYDDSYAFISLADAQKILGLGVGVNKLHLRVEDIDQVASIRSTIEESLGYPYNVRDWTQLFPEFFRWMELEKWAIFIALSLIILVAAFNIMSILAMSILAKTPEIGILRTMGSTASGIRRIFVYQGMVIGSAGTILGCLIGFVLCVLQQQFKLISIPGDVYIINSLPIDMEWLDFALVSAVSLGICWLVSSYSARKAAALMPVEAIRYIL